MKLKLYLFLSCIFLTGLSIGQSRKERIAQNNFDQLSYVDAIKQSVRNLILTNYGEKLFNPKFGGNVTSYLFENVNRYTQLSIYTEINSILAKFEKRITDVDVRVDDDIDDNSYNIAISFRIKTSDELAEIGFALKRLR